jgi:ribonuclease D
MITTITKEEVAQLPVEFFTGKIIVVQTENEVDKAVDYLKKHPVIGFDTETKPTFRKGQINQVALLQLSTDDSCFLFRLNYTGFSPSLVELLTNPSIKKIGLSIKDDFGSLRKRGTFIPQGFVDLQEIVPRYNIEEKSLQKIYAILFGKKISKNQRLSNWENDILTDAQKTYAATDAWACYKIYKELEHTKNGSPIKPEESRAER